MKVRLARIAHARSGDKADRIDIGLFAYDAATWPVLVREVSAERVAQHFAWMARGPVVCHVLENILALKFVIDGALQGGAARNLRSDNLGKTAAAVLLRMDVEVTDEEAARLPRLQSGG